MHALTRCLHAIILRAHMRARAHVHAHLTSMLMHLLPLAVAHAGPDQPTKPNPVLCVWGGCSASVDTTMAKLLLVCACECGRCADVVESLRQSGGERWAAAAAGWQQRRLVLAAGQARCIMQRTDTDTRPGRGRGAWAAHLSGKGSPYCTKPYAMETLGLRYVKL